MPDVAVLPAAAGLAHEAPLAVRGPAHGLAVGDLGLADVGVDPELAHHAVDDDVEVELAHARDEGLPGLRVGLDAEGGVLLGQALQGDPQLVLVGLGLGLDGLTSMTGSRKVIDSSRTGWSGSVSVSPVEVSLEADGGGDVAGEDLVDLLAVVGVHLDEAPDALLACPWWS